MHPLWALPVTLVLIVLLGTPLVRRVVPGLPRDMEFACGLGLGVGLLASIGFVLSVLHVPTRTGFVLALGPTVSASLLAGGLPRLPIGRAARLLAPLPWFAAAGLALVALQRAPQGVWTFDWAYHYVADVRYADPSGIGDPRIGVMGWSILARPPVFNLARVPAEVLVGQSYAAAEAAGIAVALVLPAGSWLFLREIAPLARARTALFLLPASAFWVRLAVYPKPIGLACGLFLACLGLALRARRRPRRGLIPLAAALGGFAGLTHPVAGLGLLLVGIDALRRAGNRERLTSLASIFAIALPWPLWASWVTGGNLAAHDPIRPYFKHAPLGEGIGSFVNMAWNLVASFFPVPLVGHATALAARVVPPSRDAAVHVLLDAELTCAAGALGFTWLALVLARPSRLEPPLARPRLFAGVIAAASALTLLGTVSILGQGGLHPPPHPHGPAMTDNAVVIWFLPLSTVLLAWIAYRISRCPPVPNGARADLVFGTAAIEVAFALVLDEKAEYHGIAHTAFTPAVLAGTLWAWTRLAPGARTLKALFSVEGIAVLVFLGIAGGLGALPPDDQLEYKAQLGLVSLHDAVGIISFVGAPVLALVGWRVARSP
jgi:hypothetical protein